jgi:hypothetical protein
MNLCSIAYLHSTSSTCQQQQHCFLAPPPAGQRRGAFTGLVWWPHFKYCLHSEPLKSLGAIHHIIIVCILNSQCSGNLTSCMQVQVCVTGILSLSFRTEKCKYRTRNFLNSISQKVIKSFKELLFSLRLNFNGFVS